MPTRVFSSILLSLLTLGLPLAAQTDSGLPPLIDRELLFGNPEIAAAQLSPDGKYLSFLKPYKDTRNLWVKKIEEPFSAARLLTTETKRPLAGYFWSKDSKFLIFIKDNEGDENFNIYSVSPTAPSAPGADAPPARDLTGAKGIQIRIFDLPKSDPDLAYIGLNDRDKAWHDLYRLKISTGEKTLVRQNTERIADWIFDRQGQLRLAFRALDNGDQQVLRVDADQFTPIYTCGVFDTCNPVGFHKDGKQVYLNSNKGNLDLSSLLLLEVASGKTTFVESDPQKKVDLAFAAFSDATDDLVLTAYVAEKTKLYFKDKTLAADYKFLQSKLPGREIAFVSNSQDESQWLINAFSDVEPGEVYFFDRKSNKLELQYKVRETLPRAALSAIRPIEYKSSDGLVIPAYLTLPKGLPAKNLPVVIVPHGGPWARDNWGFNGMAQFLANRGYAVLQPNFRGSTGYGKKFLNAGNGEWGKKMQDDITWGAKHLVALGVADPKRIGIMGGSYGGYATLAGVAFTPELYRAAVDIVGPSNLNTLLEAIPPYWESFRKIMFSRMADPNTPEGKAWLKERSPLTQADKIKTPLLVVQGANDPRVNKAEADQIVIALRDRKFPVEYIVAPDEGHGFARPVNNMAMFMAIEKFLALHLDGRYQQGAKPEVATRLKEITVDPATVKLAPKLDTKSIGAATPAFPLTPGATKHAMTIALGAQKMSMQLKTVIVSKDGFIEASESIEGPMGVITDKITLDPKTLAPRTRVYRQGPATATVDYSPTKVSGKMSMGGQDRPIDAETGGPLFADGPAAGDVLGTLPLAEGYTATLRRFDLQTAKIKVTVVKVAGSEEVSVPAGSFQSWKLELTDANGGPDKSTVWIAKQSRQAVKLETVLPQMNGALLSAELLPN